METEQIQARIAAKDAQALYEIAARNGRSVEELIQQAVHEFLAHQQLADPEWRGRLDAVLARIQSRIPPEISPEEIEMDIDAAVAEVRDARRTGSR